MTKKAKIRYKAKIKTWLITKANMENLGKRRKQIVNNEN